MAFTAAPRITLVTDGLVRLSDANAENLFGLDEDASGTIGLFEKTTPAEVTLPAAFKPRDYVNGIGEAVSLQDSISVEIVPTDVGVLSVPVKVVKTGTTPEDFEITLTGTAAAEGGGSDFEVYIRFH